MGNMGNIMVPVYLYDSKYCSFRYIYLGESMTKYSSYLSKEDVTQSHSVVCSLDSVIDVYPTRLFTIPIGQAIGCNRVALVNLVHLLKHKQ